MDTSNSEFKVGDWVKGRTRNEEWVHGYLESFEPYNPLVRVRVMFSDNSGFVGRTIRIEKRDMEKQEMLTSYSEGELLNLIDLALSTRDKDWFIELSEKLKRKQNIISFIKRGI